MCWLTLRSDVRPCPERSMQNLQKAAGQDPAAGGNRLRSLIPRVYSNPGKSQDLTADISSTGPINRARKMLLFHRTVALTIRMTLRRGSREDLFDRPFEQAGLGAIRRRGGADGCHWSVG